MAKPNLKRRLGAILAAALLVWFVVMAVGGDSGALALFRARDTHTDLADRVKRLEEENQRLRDEIERLKDDPGTIERLAREELMMARPDEEVILVKDPKEAKEEQEEAALLDPVTPR